MAKRAGLRNRRIRPLVRDVRENFEARLEGLPSVSDCDGLFIEEKVVDAVFDQLRVLKVLAG